MRYCLAIIFTFVCTDLFSQSPVKSIGGKFGNQISYKTCDVTAFVVDDGTFGIKFPDKKGLTKYFSDRVQYEKIKGLTGKVFIQIILMDNGKPCSKSISKISGNFTVNDLDQLALDSIINKMPRWTIAKPINLGNQKANYSIALDVILNGKSGLIVNYMPQNYIIGEIK